MLDSSPVHPDFVIDGIGELSNVDRELEQRLLVRVKRPTGHAGSSE